MSETGCLKDGHFQNLEVGGTTIFSGNFDTTLVRSKYDLGANVAIAFQSDGTTGDSGIAGESNQWNFRCGNTLEVVSLGDNQTLMGPVLATTGLNVSGDQTNNDGVVFRGRYFLAMGKLNKDYFKVGTSPAFYAYIKFSVEDVSGFGDCRFGFVKVEAHNNDPDGLDEAACIGWIASAEPASVGTHTILNGASTVPTNLTAPASGEWADGATHTFKVLVSAKGAVTYEYDGESPTGAIAFTFDDAEEVTPFFFARHDSDVGGALIWQELEFGLQ